MTKENQRQLSLKSMGGSKLLHTLPRAGRAHIFASLMQEAPAKRKSEITSAVFAFGCAVDAGDITRAKKIMEKHSLDPQEHCAELLSQGIAQLRARSKYDLADEFEIRFNMGGEARERFARRMQGLVEDAQESLGKTDYSDAYSLTRFTQVLEEEEKMGVCFSTREAAVGLATIHLRMNEFKKATEIVGRYLLDGGKELSTSETQKLSEEVKRLIGRVSDSYLREIAGIAIESPALLGVCEGAIAARTSEYPFDNVDALEKKSSLLRIFGMQEKAKELSMLAVNILVGQADADPWKFYKEYLRAARIAAIAEEHEKMDECVFKFLAVCEERGEKEKNLFIYVEGVDAALEFSIVNTAEKLGEKAFYAFLSYGGYAEALELAVKMGKRDLAAIADGMLKRLD